MGKYSKTVVTKSTDPFFDDVFKEAQPDPKFQPKKKNIKKKIKKDMKVVRLGKRMDQLAAFKIMNEALKEKQEVFEQEIRQELIQVSATEAYQTKENPESFIVSGTMTQMTCDTRKIGSNVELEPELLQRFDELGISYEKDVRIPARYVIDPDQDQEILAIVAALIQTHPVLKNKPIVYKQEETSISAVGENTRIDMSKKMKEKEFKSTYMKVALNAFRKWILESKSIKDSDKKVTKEAKNFALPLLQKMAIVPKKLRN